MARASLLGDDRYAAALPIQAKDPGALKPLASAKAKNIIYLFTCREVSLPA
jgi:hypothetical protein